MTLDLGTGDGRAVLRRAAEDPRALHIGLDLDRRALEAASTRALRRPERGGRPNALFVLGDATDPPEELSGLASEVTALFPWGSLLRALVAPDLDVLCCLRALGDPGARLEVVTSLEPRDGGEAARLGLAASRLDPAGLRGAYRSAGFAAVEMRPLSAEELRAVPSTWARRLAYGSPRTVWRLTATA